MLVHVLTYPAERNGRKTLTTVQGLSKDYNPKALLKAFKKEYGKCNSLAFRFGIFLLDLLVHLADLFSLSLSACNGTIIQDKDMGEVIQLQGDHRTKVMDFLTDKDKDKMGKYALPKDNIKVSCSAKTDFDSSSR